MKTFDKIAKFVFRVSTLFLAILLIGDSVYSFKVGLQHHGYVVAVWGAFIITIRELDKVYRE